MYYKDFDNWSIVKKRINQEERKINIRAGEIRWVSFGVNIGSEMDGKGVSFTRPALVVNVSGAHLALVVPLSTKLKDVAGYSPFTWKGTTTALCIHQTRVISQKRILHRIGKISNNALMKYKQHIKGFFAL
ncbi:MAG: type II toxin-antitoxin system PemK/MazF family toxin [Chitinophagales bacterium]|nr:type II toxin-antitoxin system PemK/MazF family toxin [Chitinophagales bacterium]